MQPVQRFAVRPVAAVAVVVAVVLTAVSWRYGFHRDELYFLVAGHHLAPSYVDQPVLTPLLTRAVTALLGESPAGLRVLATLAGAGAVLLVALAARELGGGRGAQVLAAVGAATSSYVLVVAHMVSTATFDLVLWLALGLLVLRLLRTREPRWWLAVGAVAGIALENKDLVVLLAFAFAVGVLVLGPRDVLRTWWLPAGVAVALVLAAPNLVWQAAHGWPQLTVAGGISADDGLENRALFVPLQIVYLSPFHVPVWVAGLVRLWRRPDLRWARSLGLAYPVLVALILVLGGKSYYSIPLLLLVFAAGTEPAIAWLARGARRRAVAGVVAALTAAISLVVALPLLPTSALGPVLALNAEQGEQVGWPDLASTVARAWQDVPAGSRPRAVVFTSNYGEAGAIDRYGPALGLPRAYSGHMAYADWGRPPDTATGPVLVVSPSFVPPAYLARSFTGCRVVATVRTGVDDDEDGTLVRRCTGTTRPWSAVWPGLRHYY